MGRASGRRRTREPMTLGITWDARAIRWPLDASIITVRSCQKIIATNVLALYDHRRASQPVNLSRNILASVRALLPVLRRSSQEAARRDLSRSPPCPHAANPLLHSRIVSSLQAHALLQVHFGEPQRA